MQDFELHIIEATHRSDESLSPNRRRSEVKGVTLRLDSLSLDYRGIRRRSTDQLARKENVEDKIEETLAEPRR